MAWLDRLRFDVSQIIDGLGDKIDIRSRFNGCGAGGTPEKHIDCAVSSDVSADAIQRLIKIMKYGRSRPILMEQ